MTCILCNKMFEKKISIIDSLKVKLGKKVYQKNGDAYSIHYIPGSFFALYYYSILPFLMFYWFIWVLSFQAIEYIFDGFIQGWVTSTIVSIMATIIYLAIEYLTALLVPLKKV